MPANAAVADVLTLVGAVLRSSRSSPRSCPSCVRYRSGDELARQQIKWLGVAALFTTACLLVGLGAALAGAATVGYALILGSVLSIPLAIGVAILRYRLYDVDRVISRSLTYGLVTVTLAAAYTALVLIGQALFSSFAGGSNLAIAVLDARRRRAVPARARAGAAVRRPPLLPAALRRAAHAGGVRGAAARARSSSTGSAPTSRDVVAETMQPAHVSLWLREEAR